MGEVLLLLVVALTVAAVVFGVTVLVSGRDPGLVPAEPDGRAVPLPGSRPLHESDVAEVRFDTALRGYRMAQVDQALRRAAYDIGYKSELIGVLEAEVAALRAGRTEEADALRRTREEAAGTNPADVPGDPGDETTRISADAPPADTPADDPTGEASDKPAAEAPLTADAGVAAAPAAAAVEDEAMLPSDTPTPSGPAVPVAAPADEAAADRAASAEPTSAPATEASGAAAAGDGERQRGPAVRSESA